MYKNQKKVRQQFICKTFPFINIPYFIILSTVHLRDNKFCSQKQKKNRKNCVKQYFFLFVFSDTW